MNFAALMMLQIEFPKWIKPVFLELGPGGALSRMARDRLGPEVEARSASEFRSLDTVAAWLRKRIGAFSTRY